jgi:hypothetical protein
VTWLHRTYVACLRTARSAAYPTGLLPVMARSRSLAVRHLRSLFAIYDIGDLATLDLAWWSYPALRRVEQFLAGRPGARVFEFGAGASTVWLARRAAHVFSVEHDAACASTVSELLRDLDCGSRVTLHAVPATPANGLASVRSERRDHVGLDFSEYVQTIDRVGGPFDLIIIDGRARVEAFTRAIRHLAPDGLVVFDNIQRNRYRAVLGRPDLHYELLRGATPALPYPTTTGLITYR